MIAELQAAVIELLEAHRASSPEWNVQRVSAYGGQTSDPKIMKTVTATPQVFVDSPLSSKIKRSGPSGQLLVGEFPIDVIVFVENKVSKTASASEAAKATDWLLDATIGKFVKVGDYPALVADEIDFVTVTLQERRYVVATFKMTVEVE